jgi:hypothetical protein
MLWPAASEGASGVTETLAAVAPVTLSEALAVAEPDCAVMVTAPTPDEVARPALLIVVMEVTLEVQVTAVLRSCVEPSLNVPVAWNCCAVPLAILAEDGVIARETSVAGLTVSVTMAFMLPLIAHICALPLLTPVASPAVVMDATLVTDDCQVTLEVRSRVEPSE